MKIRRYLEPYLAEDLQRKMAWISGPRQVGKTTLCRQLLSRHTSDQYLNWDDAEQRTRILKRQWREDSKLVVFDELHKMPTWKNWLKGLYDTKTSHQQFLVTGSARLDVYRRGGDSMLGRYHHWRLHPFSMDEYPNDMSASEALERLLERGGFPEPFLSDRMRDVKRWRLNRMDRVILEDIRDLHPVQNIHAIQILVDLLKERVSGLVIPSNIAEDLRVSPQTVQSWCERLESLYLVFRVTPYHHQLSRSIRKPYKLYFMDHADSLGTPGARFENLVACHLLKQLHFRQDAWGERTALHFLRDKEGREVDFLTVVDGKIQDLIEVKTHDTSISPSLRYYQKRLKPQRTIQLLQKPMTSYHDQGIWVTSLTEFAQNPLWEAPELDL